jgi:hypothetical protein
MNAKNIEEVSADLEEDIETVKEFANACQDSENKAKKFS